MLEKNESLVFNILDDFLDSDQKIVNQEENYFYEDFDDLRTKVIIEINELLMNEFFKEKIDLHSFKKKIDSINKKHSLWGFRGINGQMFFNQLYKCSNDKNELQNVLIHTLKVPLNINEAKEKIIKLSDYVKGVSVDVPDKRKAPRPKSILFFLSYFWQIQKPNEFPIFYNSLETVFLELEILEQKDNLDDYYEGFYKLNEEIRKLFEKKLKKEINLWFIEHVFWRYYTLEQEEIPPNMKEEIKRERIKIETYSDYIPPVISNIVNLSKNEASPSNFESATEKLFIMLGFDVELLGQGKGRTADLIVRGYGYGMSKPYVILIDCKARGKEDFKINAGEERTIIEYIKNFLYDSPRDRASDISFLLISSGFGDIPESVLRKIKSETGIDVSFITVDSLLFLLAMKLQRWEIDIEKIKRVFEKQGKITKEFIQEVLIGR